MKIKIFENILLRDCLKQCLDEGYKPATWKQLYKLLEKKKIPNQWYNTANLVRKGELIEASLSQLKNIAKTYEQGWRLWYVNRLLGGSDEWGYYRLDGDVGRIVGVKK